MHQENYDRCVEIDETHQYLRRDCLETTGIPALPEENTQNLAMELASAIGVEVLPATKIIKDRLIIKLTSRDKRDEFYKKRSNLKGKNTSILPTIRTHYG